MIEILPTEAASISQNFREPSLADKAYHLILDQMLRGNLSAGSVLSRRKLAGQFRMSLVPVAQALQRLEIEGLLESRPRAGTRVKIPTPDEIRGRFELREALECQSARLCAERSSFQERLELRRMATNMDAIYAKLVAQKGTDEWAFAVNKYHVDLHMRIATCARSELLKAEIEKSHVLIFNWFYDTALGQRILPPNFHQNLISVIVEGEPQKAEQGMRAHVIYGLNSIQRAMEPLQAKHWRVKQAVGKKRTGRSEHRSRPAHISRGRMD